VAFLHVYQNGIYTVPLATYQQLVQGEIYTRDMAVLHVYIRMGSGAATSYYQQLVPGRNIHPGTWHLYISEWVLQCCYYYQQLATRRNIHPGTWHSSMYIRMGSTGACDYYQQLVPGEIYTQGHGIPPCI
jgi:hypothetical protein